jgi:RIO kinase 2
MSEYNIILKPDGHVLLIDWPQYVTLEHSNASDFLKRDVRNVLNYFSRKFKLKIRINEALEYVTGTRRKLL